MSATIDKLARENEGRLNVLQEGLGYCFIDRSHLQRALVHSSFAFEQGEPGNDNETLEFLGDAVLDLAVGHLLFNRYRNMKEGELTRLRSALVKERNLASMARRINLGEHLLVGRGEESSRGREKSSILASAYEAVVGAIFVDSGYDRVEKFVEEHFTPLIRGQREVLLAGDAKSMLQERMQAACNEAPTYTTEKMDGPAHKRMFTVSVMFRDQVLGSGRARSKKEAEQQAAAAALEDIESILATL
jgi:ribonuclease-3